MVVKVVQTRINMTKRYAGSTIVVSAPMDSTANSIIVAGSVINLDMELTSAGKPNQGKRNREDPVFMTLMGNESQTEENSNLMTKQLN